MALRSSMVPMPPPIGQAPKPITGTDGPSRPSWRCCTRVCRISGLDDPQAMAEAVEAGEYQRAPHNRGALDRRRYR